MEKKGLELKKMREIDRQLFDAVEEGKVEKVKSLIGKLANVNATDDNDGWTPLHLACDMGDIAIVELLIQSGATGAQ